MEIFKTLNGDSNYIITNYGRLFRNTHGIFIECTYLYHNSGYKMVNVNRNMTRYIHRMVAINFIKNENLENNVINHIDGNKLNNHVGNLEWCTIGYNIKHAWANGMISGGGLGRVRPIICVQTQIIYDSMEDACRNLGIENSNLNRAVRYKQKVGGYNFDYIDLNKNDFEYIYIDENLELIK